GHVDVGFMSTALATPNANSGLLRTLAVSGRQRAPSLPEVPTMQELGYGEMDVTGYFGLWFPAGAAPARLDLINREARKALEAPAVRKVFLDSGLRPVGSSAEEFARYLKQDLAWQKDIIRRIGLAPQQSRGFRPDIAMHHFAYRDGVMHAESVNLVALADAVETPFYCYSMATLERHYRVFADAFADVPALVCYAMKANSNQAVVKTLAALGAGADVVSDGELKRARSAGIAPDKIMFSGIGKTARELALAVDEGILCVNVESEAELDLLSSIAAGKGRVANISVRVNPDVDARTHAKIATGKAENKF